MESANYVEPGSGRVRRKEHALDKSFAAVEEDKKEWKSGKDI